METNYRIRNFRLVDHATVRAAFDVDFGPVVVKGFQLVEANGGRFISEPSEKYTKDGETKFRRIVEFGDDLVKARLGKAISQLYQSQSEGQGFRSGQSHQQPAPGNEAPHPGFGFDEDPFD